MKHILTCLTVLAGLSFALIASAETPAIANNTDIKNTAQIEKATAGQTASIASLSDPGNFMTSNDHVEVNGYLIYSAATKFTGTALEEKLTSLGARIATEPEREAYLEKYSALPISDGFSQIMIALKSDQKDKIVALGGGAKDSPSTAAPSS